MVNGSPNPYGKTIGSSGNVVKHILADNMIPLIFLYLSASNVVENARRHGLNMPIVPVCFQITSTE
jgi:hypothetical protein